MSEFDKDTNNEELEAGKETLHQESIEAPIEEPIQKPGTIDHESEEAHIIQKDVNSNEGVGKVLNEAETSGANQSPKSNIAVDLLLGLGLSILTYIIIMSFTLSSISLLVKALIDLVILTVYGFLTVKFFRTNHVTAAIIMLILIAPIILLLLLFGACGLMVSPY